MDIRVLEEIFDELISSLENVESRNAATLEFLKAQGIAKDEELAPYLEEAGAASSVRWRAARVRLQRILSSAVEAEERAQQKAKDEAREEPTGGRAGKAGTRDDKEKLTQQAAELAKAPGTEDTAKPESHDKQGEGTSGKPYPGITAQSKAKDTQPKENLNRAAKQTAGMPKDEGASKPRNAA
jgi:hypothetical protein